MRRSRDALAVATAFAELAAVDNAAQTGADLGQRLVDVTVELLDVWAAGVLLESPGGQPEVLACSSHEALLVESIQVGSGQGPCLSAIARDEVVVVHDLATVEREWPDWCAGARQLGVRSAYGVPIRVQGRPFGAINVFLRQGPVLSDDDLGVAAALAAVAGAALLTRRAVDEATTRVGHLQAALDSRVVLEQAKGRLAERRGIGAHEAFDLIRRRARAQQRPVTDVARAVLDGTEAPFV